MSSGFKYRVYGLNVFSEFEFLELSSANFEAEDVILRAGDLPDRLEYAEQRYEWIEFGDACCFFKIPGVAKYLIRDGNEIIVDTNQSKNAGPSKNNAESDFKLFVLGSCFGALLHQRKLIPLHVSAVALDDCVWAFTGDSGAGKSTIGTFLSKTYGLTLMCDDVGVVRESNNVFKFFPGPRKVKLWQDAANFFDYDTMELDRISNDTPKYEVHLDHENYGEGLPLAGVVNLKKTSDSSYALISRLSGAEAFEVACATVYRPLFARHFRSSRDLMMSIAKLANQVAFFNYRRKWDLNGIHAQMEPLEDQMGIRKLDKSATAGV